MHPSTTQSAGHFTITLTTHSHTHTYTHVRWVGTAEKKTEGGFERGGKMRVVECLRQTVPNRWASVRK